MRQRLLHTVSEELELAHRRIQCARPGPHGAPGELRALRFEAARLGRVIHLLKPQTFPRARRETGDAFSLLTNGLLPAQAEALRRSVRLETELGVSRGPAVESRALLEAFVVCVESALSAGGTWFEVRARPVLSRLACELRTDAHVPNTGLGMMVLSEVMRRTNDSAILTRDSEPATGTVVTMVINLEPRSLAMASAPERETRAVASAR